MAIEFLEDVPTLAILPVKGKVAPIFIVGFTDLLGISEVFKR